MCLCIPANNKYLNYDAHCIKMAMTTLLVHFFIMVVPSHVLARIGYDLLSDQIVQFVSNVISMIFRL